MGSLLEMTQLFPQDHTLEPQLAPAGQLSTLVPAPQAGELQTLGLHGCFLLLSLSQES